MAKENNSVWTLPLFQLAGIPIRVHVTLLLFLSWIAFEQAHSGGQPIREVLFVSSLLGCVLLHELGHALMAKRFKIPTRDIVLYPFGGIATMLAEARPVAELLIAVAGPAVNFTIALIIFPLVNFEQAITLDGSIDFAGKFFWSNIVLGIFNLIPALPMDGGRILRACLALCSVERATAIAARIGQILSLLMGAVAIYLGHPLLLVIAALVFSSAVQEHLRERARSAASGHKVQDVMIDASQLLTFSHGTTVSEALKTALKSSQAVFPICHNGDTVGIIERQRLLELGATEEEDSYVSGHMTRDFAQASPDEALSSLIDRIQNAPSNTLLIMQQGKLCGILVKEMLLEYLLVQEMRTRVQINRKDWHDEEI